MSLKQVYGFNKLFKRVDINNFFFYSFERLQGQGFQWELNQELVLIVMP